MSEFAQPMLVGVIERLRKLGIPLISVDHVTGAYDVSQVLIPHDGHPNAFTTELIAGELKHHLMLQ
jgi:hypothetical protein